MFKALYIHIPKTGGSSVCTAPWVLVHGSHHISPKIPLSSIDSLAVSFTFTRDPYTKFVSGVLNHGYATPETFTEFVKTTFLSEYAKRFSEFKEWSWPELQPQHRFIYFNGKNEVDLVGRLEDIEVGWADLCKIVGEKFDLPHLNEGKYQNHLDFYTEETMKIIARVYSRDFELFEYQK